MKKLIFFAMLTGTLYGADTIIKYDEDADTLTGKFPVGEATQTALDLKVDKAGDTVTGPLLTTVDQLTTAPASDELATAGWVRSLNMTGSAWYFTDTVTNYLNDKTVNTNFVALSLTPSAAVFTNSITSPVTTNAPYIVGGVVTQVYSIVNAPITLRAFLNITGGNILSAIGIAVNVYIYDTGTTNLVAEYYANPQTVDATTPTQYDWILAFPTAEQNGGYDVVAYLKVETVAGAACGLNIYGGGIYASHLDLPGTVEGQSPSELIALIDGKVDINNGIATNLTLIGNRTIQLAPTSVATNNGSLLLAAYAKAQTMSPAVSNEVTIILPPATYDIGASTLNMTSEYVNIVGQVPVTMTMIGKVTTPEGLVGSSAVLTGEEPRTIIMSSGVTISNKVNNGSVYYVKVIGDVVTDGAKAAIWQDVWFAGNVDKELPTSNTFIRVYAPLGICGDPDLSYDGNNVFRGKAEMAVISGDYCVGGGGTASGIFTDCTISGTYCVGGDFGDASGTFTGCTISGAGSVGGGGDASGTFTGCTISGAYCVGSGGDASGTFTDCTISGDYCVGSGGFASGTFTDCTISGDYCVGGGGSASGINVFQTKITGPNQMANATFSTNSLFSFSTGIPLAITNSVAKVFNCATETLVPVPNQ